MRISDRAQEILEKYWVEDKEHCRKWKMEIIHGDPIAKEMIKAGYAKSSANKLELTKKGWDEARSCVRRHRLAERLLTDVLDVKKSRIHDLGCRFEHVLQKDVEENICTLLGHPTSCPHGRPIPDGVCCKENKRRPLRMVVPLSECEIKEKGKIAYIRTRKAEVLNKLTAMGILPGISIQLLRRTPTYLFKMGESQFAIDKFLAEKIQVRISK